MKFKIIEKVAFFNLIVFSFIGFVFIANLTHELQHKKDLQHYVEDDLICLLIMPEDHLIKSFFTQPIASYEFTYNQSNKEEIEYLRKVSEIKAYSITFLLAIIFLVSFAIVLKKRYKEVYTWASSYSG